MICAILGVPGGSVQVSLRFRACRERRQNRRPGARASPVTFALRRGAPGVIGRQIQPWYHIRAYQELYGMTLAASTG